MYATSWMRVSNGSVDDLALERSEDNESEVYVDIDYACTMADKSFRSRDDGIKADA